MLSWTEYNTPPPEYSDFPTPYWEGHYKEFYFGVVCDGIRFRWFISQGLDGDRDKNAIILVDGYEPTPLDARNEAAAWWNEHKDNIKPRNNHM